VLVKRFCENQQVSDSDNHGAQDWTQIPWPKLYSRFPDFTILLNTLRYHPIPYSLYLHMQKIGIIGSGDIIQKAYLPVISRRPVELHLFARNSGLRKNLARQYGIKYVHSSLESLISSGVRGAFVHTSTSSHYEILTQLLSHGIHVYVDKPVTYEYTSSEQLFGLARMNKARLMVGFNRRYAPAYRRLKELENVNMVIMQKNRKVLPADIRTFVFDDFIHVVDTLLYLFPHPTHSLTVLGRRQNGLLYHVAVQFGFPDGFIAMGIMNRDSGTVEEKLEVFTPDGKWQVSNVTDTVLYQDKNETRMGNNDWESTLYKRGFEQIVDEFLSCMEDDGIPFQYQIPDPLATHKVCEEIVERLENEIL
jgi:virulence factor